jgi:hypothetical protein
MPITRDTIRRKAKRTLASRSMSIRNTSGGALLTTYTEANGKSFVAVLIYKYKANFAGIRQ